MYLGILLFVPVYYLLAAMAIVMGYDLLVMVGVFAVSLGGMWFIRVFVEQLSPRDMFNPYVQSWAFVVGDGLLLPLAMLGFARGWQQMDPRNPFLDWNWVCMAFVVAVLGSIVFRAFDGQRYRRIGHEAALLSPTKVWHDFVVTPLIAGVLLWSAVPQLVHNRSYDTYIGLMALVVYAATVLRDGIWPVDPVRQHPRWDPANFHPVT